MSAPVPLILRGDARNLPIADASVDLIVTSPPYFGQRSYQDGGEHYEGQIGDESSPYEFLDALIEATAEMVRVLKPTGSIWVNLGDKYCYVCACDVPTAPARPAVILDPFGGTGTTALAARALGRRAIHVDLSRDYCRLAQWRVTDPGEVARAMQVEKPPATPDGMDSLLDLLTDGAA